jgi:hypothetical protein
MHTVDTVSPYNCHGISARCHYISLITGPPILVRCHRSYVYCRHRISSHCHGISARCHFIYADCQRTTNIATILFPHIATTLSGQPNYSYCLQVSILPSHLPAYCQARASLHIATASPHISAASPHIAVASLHSTMPPHFRTLPL